MCVCVCGGVLATLHMLVSRRSGKAILAGVLAACHCGTTGWGQGDVLDGPVWEQRAEVHLLHAVRDSWQTLDLGICTTEDIVFSLLRLETYPRPILESSNDTKIHTEEKEN